MTTNYDFSYNNYLNMKNHSVKIIGLSSSPRTNSNSTSLLYNMIDGARDNDADCEIINLAGLNIKACTHCDYCLSSKSCSLSDDMDGIYDRIINANAIIISSPIYFMALSAQLKLMIDRCQLFWSYKDNTGNSLINSDTVKAGRKGIFIAVGARKGESLFQGSITTMKWFFHSIEVEYWRNLLVEKCDAAGEINKSPEKLQEAYEIGCELARSYNSKDNI